MTGELAVVDGWPLSADLAILPPESSKHQVQALSQSIIIINVHLNNHPGSSLLTLTIMKLLTETSTG